MIGLTAKPAAIAALAILVAGAIQAQQAPEEWAPCVACHGANAEGLPEMDAPALAGQHDWYLLRQLEQFADGQRGDHPEDIPGQQMRPFAQALDSDQRQRLANYLSGLPAPVVTDSRQGDMMNGSRYYHARCGSCHGGQGEGNEALQSPRLNGLSADYMSRQMDHFRRGIRGGKPGDRYGRQMAMMAATIDQTQWRDILYYLGQQQ